MTISFVFSFLVKITAVLAILVALGMRLGPQLLLTDLPEGLTFNLTRPTTMIVTGANSGLGLATVQHFSHNEKATIIMACRSMERCNKAKQSIYDNLGSDAVKANLVPMPMDLSSKSSIEDFAQKLQNKPIDILVNNAGVAGSTPRLSYHEEDGIENHIRVNHLGHVYLTHCIWNNLQLAKQTPRVVVVSSLMAASASSIPTNGWYEGEEVIAKPWNLKMYGRSKRANLFWAYELQQRYPDSISVVGAHPGFTHSDLCKNGCKGGKAAQSIALSSWLVGSIKMSADDGALSQSYAAVIPQSGLYLGPSLALVGEPKILGTLQSSWHHSSFTQEESELLWDKSLQALGVQTFGVFEISEEEQSGDVEVTGEGSVDQPTTESVS